MATLATFYDHIRDISKQENISVIEAMQEAKAAGIELLEFSQNCLLGREREVEHELAAAGLRISSIPSYFNFGRDTDVDGQSAKTLEAAELLGVDRLLVIPGFFEDGDTTEEKAVQVQNMKDSINRLAEKAAARGISLVMEDYDSTAAHFSSIGGVRDFLDSCPALNCCFDTGNFRFSAEDELEAYDALRDRITHVHFKDRAYTGTDSGDKAAVDGQMLYPCAVGSGDLKLEEICERLKADGYSGILAVEFYGAVNALDTLKQSAKWIKARF